MAQNDSNYRLQNLPNDMLTEIISRVARNSRRDIQSVILASKELSTHSQEKQVSRCLNLRQLANSPVLALDNHTKVMERCLASGNMEAHYVEGILQYFHHNNTTLALEHLKIAADGPYEEGIYLYGIIMLCRGNTSEGRAYFDKLEWQTNKARADRCWRKIRRSLQGLHIRRKRCYYTSLRNNTPPTECNLNDMDTRCEKCYYFKQMRKFIRLNRH